MINASNSRFGQVFCKLICKLLVVSVPRPMLTLTSICMGSMLLMGQALAQFRVEVAGVGITQIPINLNQFKDESTSPQKITQIIQADLERSAKFKVSTNAFAMDESSRPDFNGLRQKALENFVTGSVTKLADGRFDVRFRLWDLIKTQDLGGGEFCRCGPRSQACCASNFRFYL